MASTSSPSRTDLGVVAATFLLATALVALVIYSRRKKIKDEKRTRPPISNDGIIETARRMTQTDNPFYLLGLARTFGPVVRLPLPIPGAPMVLSVSDAGVAREILADPTTTKPPSLYSNMNNVVDGYPAINALNGKSWHGRRRGAAPAFSSGHVKRMNDVALEGTEKWIEDALLPLSERGEAFDVCKEMVGIILGAISKTAFEYDLVGEERATFLGELDLALREFLDKSAANPLRPLFGFFLSERRRARVAGRKLLLLGMKIINSYRKLESPLEDTIIDCIMKNDDAYRSDEERAADVIIFLIAGHDTTAYTLSWVLRELAIHKDEQYSLRECLKPLEPSEWIHSEHLRKVVKECIRLNPVSANGSVRALGRDFHTSQGFYLPKGSVVFISMFSMMRDARIFDDPDEFVPSRWDSPTTDMSNAYIPFSFGRQNCIGQSLAYAKIYSILPRILTEFEIELVDPGIVEFFLTLKPSKTLLRCRKVK